jgi:adenine-specific DNA-methyltransferase
MTSPKDAQRLKRITAADPESRSADVVAGNVEQLKALFPDAFTEGKIDFDVLKQLLGGAVDEREEKYGLNWHGKRRARQLALTPSAGTLRPFPEESVDWDTTRNLMIEGDNLEVLKLLQKSYAGRVNLIYIDPPYNTGRDFVYLDDFRDSIQNYLALTGQVLDGRDITSNTESRGRFHTDWLNMMYSRLKVARVLLSQDGLVCVSIDDHEFAHTVTLLDEVFGRENLIGQIAVINNLKGRSDDAFIATSHESLVIYARDAAFAEVGGLPLPPHMVEEYDLEDHIGKYKLIPLKKTGKGWRKEDRPNMHYPIYVSEDCGFTSLEPFTGAIPVLPMRGDRAGRWRWGRETFAKRSDTDVVARRVRNGGLTVFTKMRLGEDGEDRTLKAKSTWLDPKFDSAAGGRDLTELSLADAFTNPKPVMFLDEVLTIATDADSLVLDFFAGSGTTGHATIARNAVDGGRRRYVLVQLPEPLNPQNKDQKLAASHCDALKRPRNIAELTKERLRRAAKKIKAENPLFAGDLGFRVFKLESSNLQTWDPERAAADVDEALLASVEHVKPGRSENDVLYELLLKLGLDLCVPIEKRTIADVVVHSVGGGVLLACLAEKVGREAVEPLALGIVEWQGELAPAGETSCVFRDSAFADDVAKTNLAVILEQHGLSNVRCL